MYMRWVAILFIASSFLFVRSVIASEGIISPIPDDFVPQKIVSKPSVSFNELLAAVPEFPMILGEATDFATPPTTPTPTALPTPNPTGTYHSTQQRSYTISLLGDSMMDTLGPVGGGLAKKLNTTYPNATFTVINHGVGAENIDSGLRRLTNGYSYLGLGRNAVLSEKPDIIVIESFGYNPYPLPDLQDALTKHWLKLAEIVDVIRRELPETRIVIAVTIAPNWDVFGDGAPGLSFDPEGKRMKVEEIKKYLESTIAFAKSQGLPLANAFTTSVDANGNGKLSYINPGDHIHYSDAGRSLMAQKIADAIIANKLLE